MAFPVSQLYPVGSGALNESMLVFSGSRNTKASQNTPGGRWNCKVTFCSGGKLDIWQRLLVWSLHHNSAPPITVFQRTTIASTIITQSQHSFSPWKPLWPQAHGGVCTPGRGLYWLQGDTMENPSHEAGHLPTTGLPGASCTCYGSSDKSNTAGQLDVSWRIFEVCPLFNACSRS